MSFSKQIKQEIIDKPIETRCCGLAFLNGLINSIGQISLNENKEDVELVINTDFYPLYNYLQSVLQRIETKCEEIQVEECFGINKTKYFKFRIRGKFLCEILIKCGLIKLNGNELVKNEIVEQDIINKECCLKSFTRGVFIGSGTTSIKINNEKRKTTGYHVEFASKKYNFLSELASALAQFDIFAKLVKRKSGYVLYVKDANEVSNILALVGAYNSVFDLQNEMATREIRNKANRQTNCESANIEKTISASIKQMNAIQTIIEKIGLENLPDDLQTVALLRLANTEESLEELLMLSKLPFTKSALNYRFKKLIKLADKIKEK